MARIAVVGSVGEDTVVHLDAPLRVGAHVEGRGLAVRLGGGGANTAVPLALAGHAVSLVAAVGNDAVGARLVDELKAAGVDIAPVRVINGGRTTRSVVMIDEAGERTIVNLHRTVEAEPPARLLDVAAEWLYVRSRALDLAPLLLRKAECSRIVAHMPPCADGGRPAHVLIGSQSDLGPGVLDDPWAAAQRIAGDLLEWVVVTRGARGAVAFGRKRRIERQARAVEVLDTTGAGDSFAAGLIHGLAGDLDMDGALDVAIAWGTEAVLWEGSQLPAAAMARLTG